MIEKIEIKGEYIKLDNLLKFSEIAVTGGEAKLLISEGKIYVNDEVCTMRGKKIRDKDQIKYLDKIIEVISIDS